MPYERIVEKIQDDHPGHKCKTGGHSTGAYDYNAEEEWFPSY